jgi:uncharacterized protein (DUF2147 family)
MRFKTLSIKSLCAPKRARDTLLLKTFLIGGIWLLGAGGATAEAKGIFGLWLTENGRAAVEILPCAGTSACGRIVWLKEPNDETGKAKLDKNNEDTALRSRPLCGLEMIGNFKRLSDEEWEEGFIYNAEDGDTYNSKMKLQGEDKLSVRGFVGISLFGKSQVWTKLSADHPRCQ